MDRARFAPALFVLTPILASCLGAGCAGKAASPPATSPDVVAPPPASAEIAGPITPPVSPALVLAADERLLVRCGVDDTPKDVIGRRAPEPTPLAPRDGSIGLLFKPRFIPDPPAPFPQMAGPRATPSPNLSVVPLAPAIARVSLLRASRSRHTLPPELAQTITSRRFEIDQCLGQRPTPSAEIGFRLRVSTSGIPIAAALLTSPLEDDVSRCVVETGCRLALPAGEPIDDLEVLASLAPVAPVYKGAVKANGTVDLPMGETTQQRAAIKRISELLTPMAQACAEKAPPAADFLLPLRLMVFKNRLGAQMPAMGGAVFDIAQCLVPKIGEAVGPLPPSLRREKFIRLYFSFQGHER